MRLKNKPIFYLFCIFKSLPFIYKKRIFTLLIFMLIGGLLEFISIGLLFPFLEFFSDSNIQNQSVLINIFGYDLNFINDVSLENIGLLLLFFVFLAAILKLYINWSAGRISASIGTKIATDAFRGLLMQNYENYLLLENSKLISTITVQVTKCASTIDVFLRAICAFTLLIFISISLISLNPFLTIILTLFLAIIYSLIVKITRQKLTKSSYIITNKEKDSLKYVKESLSGFRDIKINQSEDFFLNNFKISDQILRVNRVYSNFLDTFPKYTIEFTIVAMIILCAISVPVSYSNTFIPTLGVFAFATQKLLPSIQQIYSSWARMNNTKSDLENVCSLLFSKVVSKKIKLSLSENSSYLSDRFTFSKVQLINVSYRYPNTKKNVLNSVNLTINAGDLIGFKGISGCGKTTLVDLITGLLEPTKGEIIVDSKSIVSEENILIRKNWTSCISYVPQNVFISDQPIKNNVAFGIPDKLIDFERVKYCLDMAQLSSFIRDESGILSLKSMGDSGNRLSGGQRQRIAIARALYKRSKILILDEATSALDARTESEIIELISNLSKKMTILMVTHRISTLDICNKKFELKDGQIYLLP